MVDSTQGDCIMNKVIVALAILLLAGAANAQLILTAGFDGPLTGGTPKGVELRALADIPDLSIYGLGTSFNGGASSGQDWAFDAVSVNAGDFIYVATEAPQFTAFFGFAPTFLWTGLTINGDDVVELFKNGVVIDALGEIGVDGTGTGWDFLDGWAYRNSGTNATGAFVESDWTFSGIDALDGELTNDTAATPVPIGTYSNPVGNEITTFSAVKALFR